MATQDQVQSLYIAYFGRPADAEGLKYWTNDSTASLETIADGFATTSEYKESVEGFSAVAIINSFYENLFGRTGEVEGVTYWANEVALGNTTLQQVGVAIGQAAVNASPANSDTEAVTAKFAAANAWTAETAKSTAGLLAYSGEAGVDAGKSYLLPVKSEGTIPSEESVASSVGSLITTNGQGTVDTYTLTIFDDQVDQDGYMQLDANVNPVKQGTDFKLNAGNQTILGTTTTLNALNFFDDTLTDSSTEDTDTFVGAATDNVALWNDGDFTNIEVIKIGLDSSQTGTWAAFESIIGSKKLVISGTVENNADTEFDLGVAGVEKGIATIDATEVVGDNAVSTLSIGSDHDEDITVTVGDIKADVDLDGDGDHTVTTGKYADDIDLRALIGDATVTSNAGDDTIQTAGGNDTVDSGDGADTVTTGAGSDTISVGAGTDAVTAGADADKVTLGAGVDTATQGAGDSESYTAISGAGDIENLQNGTIFEFGDDVDVYFDFDVADDDFVTGDSSADYLAVNDDLENLAAAEENYLIRGAYDLEAKEFTADVTGVDALIIGDASSQDISTVDNLFIAMGVAGDMVAGNFA